jgi:hypothetical protein
MKTADSEEALRNEWEAGLHCCLDSLEEELNNAMAEKVRTTNALMLAKDITGNHTSAVRDCACSCFDYGV